MTQSIRTRVEASSAPLLLRLHTMPRFLVPLLLVSSLLLGFMTTGIISYFALLFVALFVTWLLFLSWPLLEPRARILRSAVVVMLLAVIVSRVLGN